MLIYKEIAIIEFYLYLCLSTADDKDKQLQEKEAELKRMQEMVAQMQQQIKQQSQTSLASVATSN